MLNKLSRNFTHYATNVRHDQLYSFIHDDDSRHVHPSNICFSFLVRFCTSASRGLITTLTSKLFAPKLQDQFISATVNTL